MPAAPRRTTRRPERVYSDDDTIWGVWGTSKSLALKAIASAARVAPSRVTIKRSRTSRTEDGTRLLRFIGTIKPEGEK